MTVKTIDVSKKLSDEQILQIVRANGMPIVYDDDCPPLTEEQFKEIQKLKELRREERNKKILSLRVSEKTLKRAQSLGKGYTGILSRILEEALNDPEMIRRCL